MFSRNFVCMKCEGNIDEAVEKESCGQCDQQVCISRRQGEHMWGCETAMTARTRFGWIVFIECEKMFPL